MSLRAFLECLKEDRDVEQFGEGSNERPPLAPEYELSSTVRESLDDDGPVIMSSSRYQPDVSSAIARHVVGGVYGSPRRIARIFGFTDCSRSYDPEYPMESYEVEDDYSTIELVKAFVEATEGDLRLGTNTMSIPSGKKEMSGWNKIDLSLLPVCHHDTLDSGPFITAGVNIMKWFDGTHGLGIHRMRIIDSEHIAVLAPPNRRVGLPYYEASKKGKSVPMAVAIGAPPEVVLASQAKVDPTAEKLAVAAKLRGKTLPLMRCNKSDLLVPASTEIVLECETIPNSEFDDTPFLEYTGTYSMRSTAWVAKVVYISTRRDPIYQTIVTGRPPQEDSNLCAVPMAAEIYKVAKKYVREITDISVFFGNSVFDAVLCVKKDSSYEIRNLIYSLLGTKYIKTVSIMDDDLGANETDWRFAFNTRFRPERDFILTQPMYGASLDPSSEVFQTTAKVGFDLTVPTGEDDMKYKRGGFAPFSFYREYVTNSHSK